jgi:alpha-L-rhamnosidase
VWERWDSFTKENGFNGAGGKNNAAMNSFSHYSFGAAIEWAFEKLAGMDTVGAGHHRIRIFPHVPSAGSNPDGKPLDWVSASTVHPRGKIASAWKREGDRITYDVTIPANTTAIVFLPEGGSITENGQPIPEGSKLKESPAGTIGFDVAAGTYRFVWSK